MDTMDATSKNQWRHVFSEIQPLRKYAKLLMQNEEIDLIYGDEEQERLKIHTTKETLPTKKYPSGSSYEGEWSHVGWEGQGEYIFPHDVKYMGGFKDTRFHGEGVLEFPMGQRLGGIWRDGKLISWKYKFSDGLEYQEPWTYCKYPDRRYYQTMLKGFHAPDKERICNYMPPRKIPDGCYDVGEGFYNPKTKCIVSAFDVGQIIRVPSHDEELWIQKNCRKAWDEPVGYRPELYEYWTTGRSSSTADLLELIQKGVPGEEAKDEEDEEID